MLLKIDFNPDNIPILYILVAFLLPLVPAILLFWVLKSRATVQGPLKGLQISLSGAFAAYFILFIIVFSAIRSWLKKPEPENEVWTITGLIKSDDGRFDIQEDHPAFSIIPLDQTFQNHRFEVHVIAHTDANGLIQFPMLTLTSLNYKSADLPDVTFHRSKDDLDSAFILDDPNSHRIKLKFPCVLEHKMKPAALDATAYLPVDTSITK